MCGCANALRQERAAGMLQAGLDSVTCDAVWDMVRDADLPPPRTKRAKLAPEAEGDHLPVWTFGLTSSGGTHVLTKVTRKMPAFTQVLASLVAKMAPNFTFTSLAVLIDAKLQYHKDMRNRGQSCLIGLSRYRGGELWVHSGVSTQPFRKVPGVEHELPGVLLPTIGPNPMPLNRSGKVPPRRLGR